MVSLKWVISGLVCLSASFASTLPAYAETLQGNVQLDESLPSLDKSFAPGEIFDLAVTEKSKGTVTFYKIPTWMAGLWKSEKARTTSFLNYQGTSNVDLGEDYIARSVGRFGDILDRGGQIWNLSHVNYWSKTEYADHCGYSLVSDFAVVQFSDKTCTTSDKSLVIMVDNATGKIISTQQRETVVFHQYQSPTIYKSTSTHKSFDWKGSPLCLVTNESYETRVAPFSNRAGEQVNGVKMSKLFADFLREKGLASLVPLDAKSLDALLR